MKEVFKSGSTTKIFLPIQPPLSTGLDGETRDGESGRTFNRGGNYPPLYTFANAAFNSARVLQPKLSRRVHDVHPVSFFLKRW